MLAWVQWVEMQLAFRCLVEQQPLEVQTLPQVPHQAMQELVLAQLELAQLELKLNSPLIHSPVWEAWAALEAWTLQ